ncbi:RNA-binding protein of the Puf family, translational repressor [Lactococcus lactis]|uniref:RNA-binding protein of the Puf family, translational repressor n=1 Tax=Lactococcus lactis TaxID=1358 RepID=A0A2X0R354_9LACT|nr:DUF1125 domain-containing protein [Lactococcus lactis]SPS11177.1 RNA-binding protein of the Puf family, translational repressor [Lactococcus lactis]SPS11878.1 RNA-binding protein of the Puf family, translational repressor [Lactococcus lactis]
MTVESLLKTIADHTAVILKDTIGNTLIKFNYGEDVEVFSPVFLYRKIKIIKIKNGSELIAILEDTKND